MLDTLQLGDKQYVLDNFDDTYAAFKMLENTMEAIKEDVKVNKQGIDLPTYEIKYSTYNKMVPVNLDDIIRRYPLQEYPDCYNISLSAKAGDIIMEPELVEYKPVETVKFTFKH